MIEIKEWLGLIGTAIGALATLGGVFLAQTLNAKNISAKEARDHVRSKCERIYNLCQLLYDGHRDELQKLQMSETATAKTWIKSRNHPGSSMSELKMLVKMYAPSLTTQIQALDLPHQALKIAFIAIDIEW
jgi:hypothetical protein